MSKRGVKYNKIQDVREGYRNLRIRKLEPRDKDRDL